MAGVFSAGAWSGIAWLVYPLDDPYIHLAMADSLAHHGVWGITPYEFTSSSSSPLWTSLLACSVFVFGNSEIIPLAWNLILASLVCLSVYGWLARMPLSKPLVFLFLLLFAFFVPLPALIYSGMEHSLHTLLSIWFAFLAAKALDSKETRRGRYLLPALAPLLVAARYEGLFLVATVVVLLLFRRRFRLALVTGFLSLSGITAIGLMAIHKGWHFFPNSLLMKGNLPDLNSMAGFLTFISTGPIQLLSNPHLMALMGILGFALILHLKRGPRDKQSILFGPLIFLVTCTMHLQFARTGWLFRYEAYLVAMGMAAMIEPVYLLRKKLNGNWTRRLGFSLAVITLCLMAIRAVASVYLLPASSRSIHDQQIQTARFLDRFYTGKTVALNDIGAPNHLADIHCVDLFGLADIEVLDLKNSGQYNRRAIDRITKEANVEIAILYEEWFSKPSIGGLPENWFRVSRWTIQNNESCAFDGISFFATNRKAAVMLADRVRQFEPELPSGVKVEIFDF
ncbi:MAG: hypothetical protein JRF33_01140 [Deltaproteobacteria bacterium]|nr:hypothetical protein [Deltaproteobacteria bacterium]